MTIRRRRGRDERGVSLVLVLVTLVVFGLLVPILGQFGTTNGVSGFLLKGQRYDRYAAEAGVQEAIAWAQANRTAGRNHLPCGGITDSIPGSSSGFDRSVTVKCQGFHDTGTPQATPKFPQYALMTAGGDINVSGGSGKTAGAWWANGNVRAPSVDATPDYVGASGSCNGLVAAPTDCGRGSGQLPPDLSVTLPSPLPDRPRHQQCAHSTGAIVPVAPGLHWERDFFDSMADAKDPSCDRVILWLQPGIHVFDFNLYDTFTRQSDPRFRLRTGRLVIVGGAISGGAASGDFDAARAAVAAGTACDPNGAGATVLFGNSASLVMQPDPGRVADLQICGPAQGTQHVALAQVQRGSDPRFADAATTPSAAVAKVTPGDSFTWPPGIPGRPAPDPLATPECSFFGGRSCDLAHYMTGGLQGDRAVGTVTMTLPDPVARDGAILRSLQLIVNHREQESERNGVQTVRLWVTGLNDSVTTECPFTDPRNEVRQSDGWRTDTITCDLRDYAEPYFRTGQPVKVNYEVTLGSGGFGDQGRNSAQVSLDFVQLKANYADPTFRTWTGSGGSPILDVNGGATARFDGTVFTPAGDVNIDFGGRSAGGFFRGAVVKSMDASGLPDDPNFAPFSLPNGGSYTDRLVTFAAYLDNDPAKAILTTRVLFCDPQPDGGAVRPPCTAAPDQDPRILAWNPTK